MRNLAAAGAPDTAHDSADAFLRVHGAPAGIQQAATNRFPQLMDTRVAERERRLRSFNRMVSHEIKGWVHGALGASEVLRGGAVDEDRREKLHEIVSDNLGALNVRLDDLLRLTWTRPGDGEQQRNVELSSAVAEAVRRLEKAADSKDVELRVAEDLPHVEVNAAVVGFALPGCPPEEGVAGGPDGPGPGIPPPTPSLDP